MDTAATAPASGEGPASGSPLAPTDPPATPPASGPSEHSARRWLMWGLGVFAYVVAVFNRSSLGVASLQAQHRFHATSAELSLFAVLQLAVYASMQIPVGALLDRFGTRRMVTAGALVMAAGQLALGLAHTLPLAILARVLVGTGDAMTFISVLRLVGLWFPSRQAAVITQLTGILGQLGQVVAAFPLVALLHSAGWEPTFVGAAATGALVGLLVLAALRDTPPDRRPVPTDALRLADMRASVRAAWHEPGTRLGLWTHFVTQFSGTVFALLWGYPFLVRGEGLSPHLAGALLSAMVFIGMGVGPLLGHLAGTWPRRRSVLTLSIVAGTAAAWTLVLVWPGRAPLGVIVVLIVVLATNGPGSMLGFDYARTFNPPARQGTASGIVNVGGFVASLSTILFVGLILDAVTTGGPASYTLGGFRAALSVQYVGWVIGLALVLHSRRVLRRRDIERGIRIDPLHRAIVRRWGDVSARR
ncbi:MAG TPA: MFS transporter [Mycobacteriales bacterium]|nr:MFS transporter [Mycobacteriales bacterium]